MVKKKSQEPARYSKDWLTKRIEDIHNSWGQVVGERHYVVEITPPQRYNYGDGHGGSDYRWTSKTEARVSQYFDDRFDAIKWISDHEPDEGKSLETRTQKLYRRVVEEWH